MAINDDLALNKSQTVNNLNAKEEPKQEKQVLLSNQKQKHVNIQNTNVETSEGPQLIKIHSVDQLNIENDKLVIGNEISNQYGEPEKSRNPIL